MRHTYILLAALAFTLNAQAQPTLTFATNAPTAGTAYTIHYGDHVAEGDDGAAQDWDLSGLTSDSTDALQLVAASTTTNGAQFPNAAVAEVSSPVTSYFQVNANGIGFAGSDDGTSLIVNTPAPRYLAFPCSMGTTWSTPYEATFSYEENDVFRTGTVTGEADGYGTVTMPWGTVTDVLRIHLVNEVQDSMELFTIDYTYDSYVYYRVGQSYPIAELVTATIDFGFGSPQVRQFSRWTEEDLSTGIAARSTPGDELHVYPNPARAGTGISLHTTVPISGDARIGLYDPDGRLVRAYSAQQLDREAGRMGLQLPSGLAPGAYRITVQQAGTRLVSTLIILDRE